MVNESDGPESGNGTEDGRTADTHVEEAVEGFLDDAEIALSEYDGGYVDADATLSVIRSCLAELRKTVDED